MKLAAVLACLALPAAAQQQETALELVLLADASGSIGPDELAFQRQGYIDALNDPQILAAIERTLHGHVAITYVEWATNQSVAVDWMLIDGAEAAAAFGDTLRDAPRAAFGRNAIGAALLEAQRLIDENDFIAPRQVIDFSGDSVNNHSGPPIAAAREEVLAKGTVINALPILRPDDPRRAGFDLEGAYESQIIGGPGAFMVTVEDEAAFAAAVRRKLLLEIAGDMPPAQIAQR